MQQGAVEPMRHDSGCSAAFTTLQFAPESTWWRCVNHLLPLLPLECCLSAPLHVDDWEQARPQIHQPPTKPKDWRTQRKA
mmetsp:Transcript_81765/g.264950  ORF Transcript_81765/g.264950 Transcript_81765/m.264950 type:complete len:80 (-) Transcript_81765:7-246(-)